VVVKKEDSTIEILARKGTIAYTRPKLMEGDINLI
jgi:hypothetical protein